MKLERVYVGFHKPGFRNAEGQIDPRCWMGHCEAWGYTCDDTWLFLDPAGAGMRVRVMHRYEDVMDHLYDRFARCELILSVPGTDPNFRIPLHGLMTCASVCGQMVGKRALFVGSLKRKLLRNGAEIVHSEKPESPQGRSRSQGRSPA
jgi:hypothetical protein